MNEWMNCANMATARAAIPPNSSLDVSEIPSVLGHRWLGDMEGIQHVKKLDVGLCCWFDWGFAHDTL